MKKSANNKPEPLTAVCKHGGFWAPLPKVFHKNKTFLVQAVAVRMSPDLVPSTVVFTPNLQTTSRIV